MKMRSLYLKLCSVWLMLMICLIPACAEKSDAVTESIYPGMSYAEFCAATDNKACFQYVGYAYYETADGNLQVVRFAEDMTSVAEVRTFRKTQTSQAVHSFESIKPGMTVWEVVEKVGLPCGSATSGMITLEFHASDGSVYVIYWDKSSDSFTVSSIVHYP